VPSKLSIIVALFILSGIALAQDLPDAPSVAVGSFPIAANGNAAAVPSSSSTYVAPPAAKGPWIDPQVADGAYWSYSSALLGSTILNVEMTARCSQRGSCLTWILDGASAGSARLQLYAYTLPTDAAVSYLAYVLKRRNSKWWVVPPALFTAANFFSAGRSYSRLQSGFGSQRSSK
jgi:hypothetical protein